MRLARGVFLGPYEIQSALGAGGMGEVYRARDTRLDRTVAIKVLPEALAVDREFRERFDREARTISQIDHPHVCALYDVGEHEGLSFLVMQYLEGQTLADRLERGALPLDEALQYARQIADALDAAHRLGVTHRDLKPGNIMLARRGGPSGPPVAKLLDFGLARAATLVETPAGFSQFPTSPPLTAQGTILGTFQYMAPEQLEGNNADPRSDIFAFGAVVYEMLTGRRAFEGKSQASLIGAIMHTEPPPVSTVQPLTPRALDRVVRKCLAKDPDERWQTARDLHDELTWIAETGAEMSPVATPKRRGTSEPVYATLAAVFLLTSVALAAWALRPSPVPAPIRFSVAAPEGEDVNTFALSPDDRFLAFTATSSRASAPVFGRALYVRPLDATSAVALAGTEGARSPFWSPDSRVIAFFADGKLKTIDAAGGVVRTICDAVGARTSGDWSRDDVILFGTEVGGSIQRVSVSGGEATPVTKAGGPNGGHFFPTWLPNGRHFLYWEQGVGIHRGTLDGTDDILVFKTAGTSWARYVEPGYLVFVRGSELLAQPFDAATGSLSGESVVLGSVGADFSNTANGFSVAGDRVLAIQSREVPDTELVWFSRSGQRQSTIAEPSQYSNPQLSPDGSKLAVQVRDRNDPGFVSDVWVIDLARGVKMRVTSEPTHGQMPVWSPDGTHIVFERPPGTSRGVFQRLASGAGPEEPLFQSSAAMDTNSYSSDGRYILYTTITEETNREVNVLPLGANRKPFPFANTRFNETQGQFSPDGNWIAYVSDGSGAIDLYIQAFPSAGARTRISTMGAAQPRWRRDGRELYYLSRAGQVMAVPIQTAPALVVGAPVPLFETATFTGSGLGTTANYDVTADGQRFIVASTVDSGTQPITVVINWMSALRK